MRPLALLLSTLALPAAAQGVAEEVSAELARIYDIEAPAANTAKLDIIDDCTLHLVTTEARGVASMNAELTAPVQAVFASYAAGLMDVEPRGDALTALLPIEGATTSVTVTLVNGTAEEQADFLSGQSVDASCDAGTCTDSFELPVFYLPAFGPGAAERLDTALAALAPVAELCAETD